MQTAETAIDRSRSGLPRTGGSIAAAGTGTANQADDLSRTDDATPQDH